MKKKINWVSVGNMVGLIVGCYHMLYTFYIICIYPFINKQIVSLTKYGFLCFILALIVVSLNFRYFEDRWEK